MAIKCKSSNGTSVGLDGYIYVDSEVMFIEVVSSRKREHSSSCRIRPTHLLFDFYSIDMENGQYLVKFSEKEFEKQRAANSKFKVKFHDRYGGLRRGICSHQVEKAVEEETYKQLVEKAVEEGYDVSKLHRTPQSDTPPESNTAHDDTRGVWRLKSIFGK